MPLVVPGITSGTASTSGEDWTSKLMGKKLGDSHSETMFKKSDLPNSHRVIEEGGMKTMDFVPDRLNVHLAKDGTVAKVNHG